MECVHCGFDNPSQTKFCTNCGKSLEKTIACPNCEKQVPKRGNFCPHCGHKLRGASRKSRSTARGLRASQPSRPSRTFSKTKLKSKNSRVRDFVIAAIIVAVLGAGIAGILYSQRPRSTTEFRPRGLPSNSFVWPREVQSIAAQLDCPCGNCELNLADCTCDNPNGALEIKSYISSLLKTDKSKDDIVKEVKAKYNQPS